MLTFAKASKAHEEHPERNEDYGLMAKRIPQSAEKDAKGESKKPTGYAATTIALALLLPLADGYLMGYAHVGDSRVYLLRENEALCRLTADDGYFEWKIGRGELNAEDAWRIEQSSAAEQLSEQDREHFDKRNRISQSLGDEAITLHTGQVVVRAGDRVLLTTDGIHDNLTDAEIEEIVRKSARTAAAKTLLKHTIASAQQDQKQHLRAKKDDLSAIVITCQAPVENPA